MSHYFTLKVLCSYGACGRRDSEEFKSRPQPSRAPYPRLGRVVTASVGSPAAAGWVHAHAAARLGHIRATGARQARACSTGLRDRATPEHALAYGAGPRRGFPGFLRAVAYSLHPDLTVASRRSRGRIFPLGRGRIDLRLFRISRGAPATPAVFDLLVEQASKIFIEGWNWAAHQQACLDALLLWPPLVQCLGQLRPLLSRAPSSPRAQPKHQITHF